MKNKKVSSNFSGIIVCDSITMSVQKKRPDIRRIEAIIIALTGFAAVILSFLNMFDFSYSRSSLIKAALIFSAVYIAFTFAGKKTYWFTGGSFFILAAAAYKYSDTLIKGYKYVYNVIYSVSTHNPIKYYKFLSPENESFCITVFFVFCIWILALVIYTFTIHKPNPVPVIIVTFPIIEIGLYNGIHIPVFWGILTVAYWLAVLAMCCTDIGEYSGGMGGFVRKDNLFFPKRQMRLKVTEKCAVMLIVSIMLVAASAIAVMKLSDYKRSEALNQKRIDIKEAVNAFTFDDVASSISNLTESFGLTLNYENHKLGNVSHVKHKNTVDLVATFDKKYSGAIYLKGYAGAVYDDNEWLSLDEDIYRKSDKLFDSFKEYSIYPQDFPHIFTEAAFPGQGSSTVWIEAKRKKNKSYAPYGTTDYGDVVYNYDTTVTSKKKNNSSYSYKFIPTEINDAVNLLVLDSELYQQYSSSQSMNDENSAVMAALIENQYRSFVYENYLGIPDNNEMTEVYQLFSDILDAETSAVTADEKLELLEQMRIKMSSLVTYSLSPGKTPSNRDFVNYFLIENKKGYCSHYATTGVILARMAGIPARYATGYIVVGDDFSDKNRNNDGSYTINLEDNRSHAWAEVYLDGFGWVPFEFTAGFSSSAINTDIITTTAPDTENLNQTTTTVASDITEPSTSASTQKQTSATSQSTQTSAVTTDVYNSGIVTTYDNDGTDSSSDSFKINTKALLTAISIILIVSAVYLRRILIIKHRKKLFSDGNIRNRVAAMYRYNEKLLSYLKIRRNGMEYIKFADYVDNLLSPDYFDKHAFRKFVDTALICSFGNYEPDTETADNALDFTRSFAMSVYRNSGFFKKIYLKIFLVIV